MVLFQNVSKVVLNYLKCIMSRNVSVRDDFTLRCGAVTIMLMADVIVRKIIIIIITIKIAIRQSQAFVFENIKLEE